MVYGGYLFGKVCQLFLENCGLYIKTGSCGSWRTTLIVEASPFDKPKLIYTTNISSFDLLRTEVMWLFDTLIIIIINGLWQLHMRIGS